MADASVAVPPRARSRARGKRRWQTLIRIAATLFLVVVLAAIFLYLRAVDWPLVVAAMHQFRWSTLATAMALALASCLLYSSFDLLSRRHVHHRIPRRWVMTAAFCAYTFNLNLGTWIGSVGMRLRLYTRLGVHSPDVLRIVAMTTVTNWQGYFALTGLALLMYPPQQLPDAWPIGPPALQLIGVGMFALSLTYLALCAFATRRSITIRKFRMHLPSLRLALVQTAVASINWVLIALIPYVVLQGAVSVSTAMVALLVACSAGAIAHVPAGIGVIDFVLLAMLGGEVATPLMVAGLLVYRAVYYLWPFSVGLVTFAVAELILRRRGARAAT